MNGFLYNRDIYLAREGGLLHSIPDLRHMEVVNLVDESAAVAVHTNQQFPLHLHQKSHRVLFTSIAIDRQTSGDFRLKI